MVARHRGTVLPVLATGPDARARLRIRLLTVASAIGLASFVLNIALIGTNPVATFYLPFSRPFELLTGAALACPWGQFSHSGAASNLRAGVGIAR